MTDSTNKLSLIIFIFNDIKTVVEDLDRPIINDDIVSVGKQNNKNSVQLVATECC